MNGWINFKELRQKLSFEEVLRHYGIEVKCKGEQHHGFCPLPNHNGKKNSPSFSANLKRGVFHCFGCGGKGNVLEFAALMEGVDVEDGSSLRQLALKLKEKFCLDTSFHRHDASKPKTEHNSSDDRPAIVNAPLDFELKELDRRHPYLEGRGFSTETVDYFGIGFAKRGMLRERIAIPLHDSEGQLIGYAGRVINDADISEENPKYRFPGERKREGKRFEFRKTLFVYNGFRIQTPVDDLLVVEGFASTWWLHQNGFLNVVATMGADCSETQVGIIVSLVKPAGRVWILPDADEAGRRLADSLLRQISPLHFTRWIKLKEGTQPTDYSPTELSQFLKVEGVGHGKP